MTDIMSDLGDVWDTLGSVEKSNISFSLAGTRQGNIIKSLVNNWDSYKSLVEKANDSSGITLENQNKHAESLAGKLAELKAVWESVWTNALSSQTLKDVVDFGTSISTVVSKLGLLKTALLTVAGITVFRNFGNIKSVISDLGKVQAAVNSMSAMGTLNNWQMWNDGSLKTATLVKYSAQVEGLSLKNAQLALSTTTLSTAQKEQVLVQAGLVASNESINASLLTQAMSNTTVSATEKENILTKAGLTTATSTCTAEKLKEVLANSMVSSTDADVIVAQLGLAAATDTTAVSFGVLSKAMLAFTASHPILLGIAAIAGALTIYSKYTQAQKEAMSATANSASTLETQTTSLNDQIETYKSLHKQLILAQGNEEETKSIKSQLLDLQKQLNETYGDEYGKINLVTDAYKDQTSAIREYNKEAAQTFLNTNPDEIDKATDKMEKKRDYTLSSYGIPSSSDEGNILKNIASQFKDINLEDTYGDGSAFTVRIKADATDASKEINDFMTAVQNKVSGTTNEYIYDDIKSYASEALKDTADILGSDEATVYNQALQAKITASDKLSSKYTEVTNAVSTYNEAVANSDNIYDDENVKESYSNLKKVQAEISNDSDWTKYKTIIDDVFSDADTASYSFYKAIKLNTDGVGDLAKELTGLDSIDLQAMVDDGDNGDIFDKLLTKASELGLESDGLISLLSALGITLDSTSNGIAMSFNSILTSIEGLATGFDQLDSIYADVYNKEDFDWSSILNNDDFTNAFSGMGDSYDNFIKQITSSPDDITACQKSFDDLATSYLYSSGVLDNLTDETKSATVSMLEQMGISNADAIVTQILAQKKQDLALANQFASLTGIDLANATVTEINQLLTEGQVTADVAEQMELLAFKKQWANKNAIVTSGDIKNLAQLATASSKLTQLLNGLASAKAAVESGAPAQAYASQISSLENQINDYVSGNFGQNTNPVYSGGTATRSAIPSAKSGSDSPAASSTASVETTVEQVDFLEIALSRVQSRMDRLKTSAENAFKSFSSRRKSYSKEIAQVTAEINLQQAAYQTYMNRANSIGLSEDWALQVRNGSVNIADISDDTLKQQISDYQDYYEKAIDAKYAVSELKTTQTELTQAKIETLITKYEKLGSVAETANDKIQNKIDLKESWGGSASVKNYTDMNKNIQTQIKYINKQASQLKLLQKTVKKGSEAWYEYKSEIDDNKSSLTDLQSQMAENATAAAQLAAAKASNKVEIYDTRDELYQAKSDNSTSSTTANKYIDKEIADIAKRQTAYNAAVSTDKSNLKSSSKSLTKTKKKKANKSILKKIKSAVKSKKEISDSLLNATLNLGDNDVLHNRCLSYNAYLTSYETDKATADLYKQTSKQDKADKATEKMTNIEDYYSERQGVIEQKETQINNAISLAEAQGYRTSKKYYSKLASLEKSNNASLVTERAKLVASLATSIEDGSIARYSPEWYKLNQQIDDVTNSIDESSLSLADFVNEMNQIDWSNFESLQDAISNVTSESDFMISQLSRDDLSSDDTGGLTDAGKAVVALRYSNYDTYMKQAENYEDEILSINKQLATDPYNETLLDQKETYVQAYQDAISGAQDEKYAVLDLVEQGYDALENKIADLVADYEDLLDAEKDAYDYQESIAEKTKSITDIKKQLQAYSNDASEEAKSKIQSLTVSLSDAETDLQDTQYDKMISNTKDMLSDLQDNLSDYVDDVISSLSENFTDLESTINSSIKDVGTTITDAMTGIGYTPTTEFKSLIGNFSSGKDIETSTNTVVKTITNFQNAMITYADKIAASVSTITASTDVNSKIRSDGGKSLSTDASKAKSKLANEKSEYAKSKYTYKEAYDKYLSYKSKYGVNSSKTKTAHEDYSKAKKAYLEEKSEYNTAKLKNTALQYLNTHLDVTTNSRGDLSDINKIFYDEYGMRVLDSSEIKELAKKLSISSTNQSSSGDLYKELKTLKINGFKNGSSSIPYDQTALTQENGQELIANTSDGSLLTRLGTGDKVFTNAMTDNLWNMSKGSNLSSGNVVVSSSGGNPISIDMGGMVIQNASNSKEIVDTMADAIATNTKMKQLLQSVTTNTLSSGYNSLSSRAYK